MTGRGELATFAARVTLRSFVPPAPPEADPTADSVDDPEPLRDRIRLAELDTVIEAALVAHWPNLVANVVTSHTDR